MPITLGGFFPKATYFIHFQCGGPIEGWRDHETLFEVHTNNTVTKEMLFAELRKIHGVGSGELDIVHLNTL